MDCEQVNTKSEKIIKKYCNSGISYRKPPFLVFFLAFYMAFFHADTLWVKFLLLLLGRICLSLILKRWVDILLNAETCKTGLMAITMQQSVDSFVQILKGNKKGKKRTRKNWEERKKKTTAKRDRYAEKKQWRTTFLFKMITIVLQ